MYTTQNLTMNIQAIFIVLLVLLHTPQRAAGFKTYNLCGGNITGTASGRIQSPNHPYQYSNNLNCTWYITTTVGQGVRLTVEHLDNREQTRCFDKLILYKRNPVQRKYFGFKRLCGSSVSDLASPYIDVSPTTPGTSVTQLAIRFTTDYATRLTGFSIVYKALCNQTLQGAFGVVKSPGYPNDYPKDARCKTTIITPPGTNVHLNFEVMDIKKTIPCSSDYVAVTSSTGGVGVGTVGGQRFAYCGNQKPNEIVSNSNDMTLEFVSDQSFTSRGFRATWSTVSATTTTTTTTPTTITTTPTTTTTTTTTTPTTTTKQTTTSTTTTPTTTTTTTPITRPTATTTTQSSTTTFPHTTQSDIKTTAVGDPEVPPLSAIASGYTGTCSTTLSGITCQRWDSNTPHVPKHKPEPSNNNYCRNPDRDPRGEWCYTTDKDKRWEYCNVKTCITTPAPPTAAATTPSPTTTTAPPPATSTAPPPATTTALPASASTAHPVTSVKVTMPTASNTTSATNSSDGTDKVAAAARENDEKPWYTFLLIGLGLLLIIVVVVVVVLLIFVRRRRKRGSHVVTDEVVFQPMIEDDWTERPRENTYVEIPFVSSELATSNGYVMANRRASIGSVDSVAAEKRNLFEDAPNTTTNGGSNVPAAETPYSMATDDEGLPHNGVAPPANDEADENPYQQIDYVRTEDVEDLKKGSGTNLVVSASPTYPKKEKKMKGFKTFFGKKKQQVKPASPAAKPKIPPTVPKRTTPVRKSPESSPKTESIRKPAVPPKQRPSIASTSQAPEVGFDDAFAPSAVANHYQSPASMKDKFASFSEEQGTQESDYAVPGEGSFRLVEEPITCSPQDGAQKSEDSEDRSPPKAPSEAKQGTPIRVPDSSFKVSIDPTAIDRMNGTVADNEEWYASPSSPVFELPPDSHYDCPNTHNDRPSSGESYCSMSKVDAPAKKTKKKMKKEQEARESGLYMHMEAQNGKAGIHYQNLSYAKHVPK